VTHKSSHPLMILVAGPYRSGTGDDPLKIEANMQKLEAAALRVFRAGHIPIIGEWVALPLMRRAGLQVMGDAVWDEMQYPTAARLIAHCDAVLRLEGDSKGADEDVRQANERGLPVYHSMDQIPAA